jgi:hypothetical protein
MKFLIERMPSRYKGMVPSRNVENKIMLASSFLKDCPFVSGMIVCHTASY